MIREFVSFPKSGRTWLRYILTTVGCASLIRFHHDGFEFNDGTRPAHNFELADRLSYYAQVDKLVYLERDPRDVMVSLYFQVTGRFQDFFDYSGDVAQFIRDDYFGACNLKVFREIWNELAARYGFLVVSYEECHADLNTVVSKILRYYELDVPASQLRSAVANADFTSMKAVEQSGHFPEPWLRLRNHAPKMRRGEIGAHRDFLTVDDIDYLDRIFFARGEKPCVSEPASARS